MKKISLINWILTLTMLSITLLVVEYVIENYLINIMPLKFQFSLPAALSVLSQSSKHGRIPQDYIAIVGDSYAQGKGDWLLNVNPNTNAPFHSAHALNELTAKDVISFGKSGASNIEGWVREPIAKYEFINKKIDDAFSKPSIVLAYFYAGNDLTENVIQIKQSFIPQYGEEGLSNNSFWQEFFKKEITQRRVAPYSNSLGDTGWLLSSIFKIIKNEFKSKDNNEEFAVFTSNPIGKINRVWVQGKQVSIPDGLQSPSLELNSSETELGFLAFTYSLQYLKNFFADSRVVVVYIPSVLESYRYASHEVKISSIETSHEKLQRDIYSTSELSTRSNELADRVKSIALALGLDYIDTRPKIMAASAQKIIHGPKDWRHFNRAGYEVLAQSIACGLAEKKIIRLKENLPSQCSI